MNYFPPPTRGRLQVSKPTLSLEDFVKSFWSILNPDSPLRWSWHMSAICDHLEAVTDGRIRSLIINIPPRTAKSSLVSVFWPAWEWGFHPTTQWITASYSQDLSERDNLSVYRLITSDPYLTAFPSFAPVRGRLLTKLENDAGGYRIATSSSPNSTITGHGADRIVIDDPLPLFSPDRRDFVNRWCSETIFSRLNNLRTSSCVVVMSRLYLNDLTGYLLENRPGVYDLISLPMEFESKDEGNLPIPTAKTSLGFEDPRTEVGQLLAENHYPRQAVDPIKSQLSSYQWKAQYQQRPQV